MHHVHQRLGAVLSETKSRRETYLDNQEIKLFLHTGLIFLSQFRLGGGVQIQIKIQLEQLEQYLKFEIKLCLAPASGKNEKILGASSGQSE